MFNYIQCVIAFLLFFQEYSFKFGGVPGFESMMVTRLSKPHLVCVCVGGGVGGLG